MSPGKYIYGLILLFSCLTTQVKSQFFWHGSGVRGRVIQKYISNGIDNASIINKTQNRGTISAKGGFFEIPAGIGDSIIISCLGYASVQAVVTYSMIIQDSLMIVEMRDIVYELDKVDIYPRYTYEQLKQKILTMKVEEDKIPTEEYKEQPIGGYGRKHDDNMGDQVGVVGSPITALYNAFSKKEAMKRKYYQLLEEDKIKAAVENRYNRNIIKVITNLPDELIDDFMNYCNLSDSFILTSDEYTLIFVVKQKFIQYEKTHRIDLNSVKFK